MAVLTVLYLAQRFGQHVPRHPTLLDHVHVLVVFPHRSPLVFALAAAFRLYGPEHIWLAVVRHLARALFGLTELPCGDGLARTPLATVDFD